MDDTFGDEREKESNKRAWRSAHSWLLLSVFSSVSMGCIYATSFCCFFPLFLFLHFHFNVLFVCIHAELQIMATPRIVCCSMCQPSDIENTLIHRYPRREFISIENTYKYSQMSESWFIVESFVNKYSDSVFVLVRQKAGHGLATLALDRWRAKIVNTFTFILSAICISLHQMARFL